MPPARVVILGVGIAGTNAALIAQGMRAQVTAIDVSFERLMEIERTLPGVATVMSTQMAIEEHVVGADLVVGAVLVPGARAPHLVSEAIVGAMQPGSVVVDLSIDQGGCFATSRMTTHSQPTYLARGVIHYCVGNMPGAVPITSTLALTNVTLPYVIQLADRGLLGAARSDAALARGINVTEGKVTNGRVAEATGNPFFPLETLLPIEFT